MTPQLFNFQQQDIRIIKDEKGNPWFIAKDICDVLDITWSGKKTLATIKDDWQRVVKVPTHQGEQKAIAISEAALYKLAFRSNKPEADTFTDWVAEEVLPSIRKTGKYVITDYLIESPRTWSKVFPDKFFEQALRLYNQPYQRGTNPPQFIGNFINEYVYRALDGQLPAELKKRQGQTSTIDEHTALMHQYLNGEGHDVLTRHLTKIVTLMEVCGTIDQFKLVWARSVSNRNQLQIYLR